MDKKAIRKALDHFENDEYVDAKDIIKREVAGSRDIFVKNKLGLTTDFNPPEPDASKDKDLDKKDDVDDVEDDNKGEE